MTPLSCVREGDLRAFALGELPAEAADRIVAHLEMCPRCESAASLLDELADPIIHSLRQALGPAHLAATLLAPSLPSADTFAAAPLRRVAGYEILGELGRGGMSIVYKARQPGPDRLVALKMILGGAHAGSEERIRFLAEADAIAQLQHPNVVHVYEVGEHDGIPFFSLELVRGGNLAQKWGGVPQPPRQAAELVETLARAVHHAHCRGVVHRDLKPANVLLTEQNEPKISDFGLAKQERPELTATGAVLGTPSYMAPEQAAGDNRTVGPATDVYALGAILYESLTGRPPFQAQTALETLEQVRFAEPVPPLRLQGKTPRDLNTLCLKCLHKEPHRRYARAEDLAEDLHRFLAGLPVLARPSPIWEHVIKWARRRPAVAGLLASLALVTFVGVALVAWKWREAVQHKDLAERRGEIAEARFREARDLVDRMLTRVADKQLTEVPQMTAVRRELLEEALTFYQGFLAERGMDLSVREETARAYGRVGAIQQALGNFERAEEAYQQALASLQRLAEELPDQDNYRHNVAWAHVQLGSLWVQERRFSQAEDAYRIALSIRQALARDFPHEPDYRAALAENYRKLGALCQSMTRHHEAQEHLQAAAAVLTPLVRELPSVPGYRQLLADTYYNRADLLLDMGQRTEAKAVAQLALEEYEQLAKASPTVAGYRFGLARMHGILGLLHKEAGALREAETSFRQSLKVGHALTDDFPAVPNYRRALTATLHNLGVVLRQQGRVAEAEDLYRPLVELLEKVAADAPTVPKYRQLLARGYYTQGNWLRAAQRSAEAESFYLKARACQESLIRQYPDDFDSRSDLGATLHNLAMQARDRSQRNEARQFLEQSVAHQRAAVKARSEHPVYQTHLRNHYLALADVLLALGEHGPAAQALRELAHVPGGNMQQADTAGWELVKCRALAERDARLAPEERQTQAQAHGAAALQAFQEAIKRDRESYLPRYHLALMAATLGDAKSYAQACAEMQQRFREPKNSDIGHWVARTCTLAAGSPTNPSWSVQLAEQGVADFPKSYFARVVAGAARFRAGDYKAARAHLDSAVALHGHGGTAWDGYWLALTYHHLGNREQVGKCQARSADWLWRADQQRLKDPVMGKGPELNQRLAIELVRRELETTLRIPAGKAEGPDANNADKTEPRP